MEFVNAKSLKTWIKQNATNRSSVFPQGWIRIEALLKFIQEAKESFDSEDD